MPTFTFIALAQRAAEGRLSRSTSPISAGFLLALAAIMVCSTFLVVAQEDSCSTWVPLACGGYTADTSTATFACALENKTKTGALNSFDTSLRPTSPTSSLTYCSQSSYYDFVVPAAVRNTTRTIVTLIGSISSSRLDDPRHATRIHVVTNSGVEYSIGELVHGFNTVIGQQKAISRPLPAYMPSTVYSYPYNGILTCSNQVAYQPWRIPAALQDLGIARVRIYDPSRILKVYSITVDTCDLYGELSEVATWMGESVTNASLALDTSQSVVRALDVNTINVWPICASVCYSEQLLGTSGACVGWFLNATSRQCFVLQNMASIEFPLASIAQNTSVGWLGVLPPRGVRRAAAAFTAGSGSGAAFPGAMFTRPDLLGGYAERSLLFMYRADARRSRRLFLRSATRYALAVTQPEVSFLTQNLLTSFATDYATGAGGRVSTCGSPGALAMVGVPFVNNNSITKCTQFGYCPPQAVGTATGTLNGHLSVSFQASPSAAVGCGGTDVGSLLLVSHDGTVYSGATYALAQTVATSRTTAAAFSDLVSSHLVASSTMSILERRDVALVDSTSTTTQSLLLYQVSTLLPTGGSFFQSPTWFWADSDQRVRIASVHCQLETAFPYTAVQGNSGYPASRYECNTSTSLMHIVERCNADPSCTGFTMLAVNSTAEVPWCLISNKTIELSDPLALDKNATLLVKAWNQSSTPDALRCRFPTYGSYGVTVRVAQGITNGNIVVKADGAVVATCPALTGQPGEASCSTFRSCYAGDIPKETAELIVELQPTSFPLLWQCSSTPMKAIVTFDGLKITPTPRASCVFVANTSLAASCVATPSISSAGAAITNATCGSVGGGRLIAHVPSPQTGCSSGASDLASVSFPMASNPVLQTLYVSLDLSNVSAQALGSAALRLYVTDGLQRQVLLGFIIASSTTLTSVAVGWSPYRSARLCANDTFSSSLWSGQLIQFPVSRLLFVNGLTRVFLRGPNATVFQVAGLVANAAGCSLPLRRNASANELMFYFVAPGVIPTAGLVLETITMSDFAECAMRCGGNAFCGVYTFVSANNSCVLRNGAGRWVPASWPLSALDVVTGTKSRSILTRSFSSVPTGTPLFAATVDLLSSQFQYVLLFAADVLPDAFSVAVQLPGLAAYQLSVLQTGFGTNGAIVSGLESYGAAQVCGNEFDPFLINGAASDNQCTHYATCKVVYPTVLTYSPLHIRAVMSASSGGTTSCTTSGPLFGFIGYNGNGVPSSNALYSALSFTATSATVSPDVLGSVVTASFDVTFNGAATKFILKESATMHPSILSSASEQQASYCRIITKTVFQVHQLRGPAPSTFYGCDSQTSIAAATAACRRDAACMGFTVSSDNSFGCFTTSASSSIASTMFLRKITTTSCSFTINTFSMVSVSVLDNNLYQGSGNNVKVKWNGRVVRVCGSSRPFISGYSLSTSPKCSTYLQCFNDLLAGVGTLEVVFPSNATTECPVFQAAAVVITPQRSASQQLAMNAAAVLPSVRSIKYSPQDISFRILQYGATRVAVHVKQDRYFAVSSVQTFALNVSIGSQVMGLCGGTVGFVEGNGLDSQCTTYYYCGPTTQNSPVAFPGLSGPITVTMENKTLCITSNCNGRFDALVLTDGMLLTGMPSQSYFRMMYTYTITSGNYSTLFDSNPATLLSHIRSNATLLGIWFPSLNGTRAMVYGTVFAHFPTVSSSASEYIALVDDVHTTEEAKMFDYGRVACVIDDFTDETVDNGCQIQLRPTHNKLVVSVAQSNFNQIGRTVSVIVNDITVATCGGDNLFQGFQGLAGLCNNYFTCFDDWVTDGALVRVVFSSIVVSTSLCTPAAMALLEATTVPYVPPLNCTDPTMPFACNVDRVCLERSDVCNDVNDCSDRSDEGRCKNWRFAGTNMGFPSCPPLATLHGITREECVRSAVVLQTPSVFQYNASVCKLFSCVDFAAPNVSTVTTPGVSFETWIYTTDPSSFLYCTDALHCNNNGVVASSVPPCTCTCLDDYTGEGCNSQLQLNLIQSIVGVLEPGVVLNNTVSSYFMSAILNYLPTGSMVSISGVEVAHNVSNSSQNQIGLFAVITDYTGAYLSTFQLNSLLVYATRSSIVSLVPGLESLTATSVVGPTARVNCYKTSLALEGTACSLSTFINDTKSVAVTVVGISFTTSDQYVDVTLTSEDGDNTTRRCSAADFTQYRDTTVAGVCSYRSVCSLNIQGIRATNVEIDFSPAVNPGSIVCNGYILVSSARVTGAIASPAGDMLTTQPSFSESHDVGYTIITAALCAIGILCLGMLVSWFRLRRKYERLKYLGPPLGFFAFAFIFGGLCGLAFYVGSASQTFSHRVLLEEYRDPTCGNSFYSSIPTRVSFLDAESEDCTLVDSIGPAEGLTYAKVQVHPNGTTPYVLFRRGSKYSCNDAPAAIVPLGRCVLESALYPEKNPWELSYVMLSADPTAVAAARLRLLNAYNPTLRLTTTMTTQSVTVGETFHTQPGSLRYYQRGVLGYQTYLLPGASEDHFTLLAWSEMSTFLQQNPNSPEFVRFRAVITTDSTALSSPETTIVDSLPFVVTRYNITNVGTSFNNFNSSDEDALETSGPFATGYRSYFAIKSSSVDAGSGDGFTVAFWIQANSRTRGFVYAVVDGWVTSLDYASKVFERMCNTVESGANFNPWFEADWHCYHAVYLSGQSETLVFVTASPDKGLVSVIWDLNQLGLSRVFDGGWHYINVVIDNSVSTSPTARLYVDGETRLNEEGWYQCVVNTVEAVKHRGSGASVRVVNNRQEVVKDDGVLLLGAVNARIFDFAIFDTAKTQEELVREGAPGMELYNSIARIESFGLGIATLLFALVNIFFTGRHLYNHFFKFDMDAESSSDDEMHIAKTAESHTRGGKTDESDPAAAAAALAGGSALTAIFNQNVPFYQFIQPVLLTVQVMALYMYAWDWPKTYSERFFGVFAIVSIDFQVMFPTTSPVTWPLVQFAAASILFLLLIGLSWRDRDNFHSIVVQFTELLRLRKKRANPFGIRGTNETRAAQPNYQWIMHTNDGTKPLTDDQEETVVRNLQALMARRMKTDANMRLHTPRLVEMGDLGTGILLYERLNGKVFISFRASDRTALEDRDASNIILTQTTIECVADNSKCPEHDMMLLPDDLMQYSCIHSSNPYYRSMECPRSCVMYACPHELCDYAVCEYCYNGGTVKAAVSGAIAAFNQLKRRGFFKITGMALVELASAVYLPVVKSAMMVLGCHAVYVCTFGECWSAFSWEYVLALIFSFTALVFFGGGYFAINAVVTFERHFLLRESLPHRPVLKRMFSFLPEFYVREMDYDDFMQIDDSLLVTLYEPFRFKHQWFPVVLYVFRFALPGAVFITDSGGLPQLLAAVVLEAFLSIAVVMAAPFKSVWIELTSRLGSIHQFVLLGLMSLHRVYIRDNPGKVGYGDQMVAATTGYLILVAILLVLLVIVPSIQSCIEARRRKQREEASANQNDNYDIGVWGEAKSRATIELEEKKKKKNGDDFTAV